MTIRVDVKDFPTVFREYAEKLGQRAKEATVRAVVNTMPELIKSSPVDTGQYAASWDFTADERGAILGNFAPHAPIIEYGTRPHRPPIGPLLAWAKRVLQDGHPPPKYSSRVWALAKRTQAKIEEWGQEPRYILTDHIPKIIRQMKIEVQNMKTITAGDLTKAATKAIIR